MNIEKIFEIILDPSNYSSEGYSSPLLMNTPILKEDKTTTEDIHLCNHYACNSLICIFPSASEGWQVSNVSKASAGTVTDRNSSMGGNNHRRYKPYRKQNTKRFHVHKLLRAKTIFFWDV